MPNPRRQPTFSGRQVTWSGYKGPLDLTHNREHPNMLPASRNRRTPSPSTVPGSTGSKSRTMPAPYARLGMLAVALPACAVGMVPDAVVVPPALQAEDTTPQSEADPQP